MAEKIAIVVPTYNRRQITLRFIHKIREQSPTIPIFVCDSGSSDGTVEALAEFEGITVLHVGSAAWWSAAVNRGIERVIAEGFSALMIKNDDIEFDDKLLADLLAKHREHPGAIISPLQESPSGPFLGMRYIGWSRKMEMLREAASDTLVETTNGCCLLVPTSLFSKVGMIDELYCPHQYGDTEFQLRAGRAGFPTVACPSIRITQLGGTDYYARLKLRTMLTFSGSPLHFGAYWGFGRTLFGGSIRFMFLGLIYHYGYIKTLVKALIHLAVVRPSPAAGA